jgi:hypothetical protein
LGNVDPTATQDPADTPDMLVSYDPPGARGPGNRDHRPPLHDSAKPSFAPPAVR